MLSKRELIKKFNESIPITPCNTKNLFVIGFMGVTGSGKSTTARVIADRLGLYVASNDEVKRFLNKEGMPGKFPKQELVNAITEETTRILYKNKVSHVIDADLTRFHSITRSIAKEHGANFIIILLRCPEEVIIKRLDERKKRIGEIMENEPDSDFKEVGWSLSVHEEYYERKKNVNDVYPIPDDIYFTFHTHKNQSEQLEKLVEKLKKDNYI